MTDQLSARDTGTDRLLVHAGGGVARITFNNPEKRNAMSIAMWEGLGQILDEFRDDHSVRVVILTGAGSRAFAVFSSNA